MPDYTVPAMPLRMSNRHRVAGETVAACIARPANTNEIPCQLASPLSSWCYGFNPTNPGSTMSKFVIIRCPTGTPIQDALFRAMADEGGVGDIIECPQDSSAWYGVMLKETVAQGFPNEHVRLHCVRIQPCNGNE